MGAWTLRILDPVMTIEPPGSWRSRASPEASGSMAGAMSRMILTVMAARAQLEREIILERQRCPTGGFISSEQPRESVALAIKGALLDGFAPLRL